MSAGGAGSREAMGLHEGVPGGAGSQEPVRGVEVREHPGSGAVSQVHLHGGPLHAVQSLLVLIVVAVFISAFTVQPFQIPSGSMEPTLLIGDFLLVDKQVFSGTPLPKRGVQRGDIIVFHYPVDPALHLIKRVVGVPGDRIRLRGGRVYRNGSAVEEPYALYRPGPRDAFRDEFPWMQRTEPGIEARWWIEMRGRIVNGELVVPPDEYFVLGDNRNNSEDSRYWGFVPKAAIVGEPVVVYFSARLAERRDDPAAPQAAEARGPVARRLGFARWGRILRVVH